MGFLDNVSLVNQIKVFTSLNKNSEEIPLNVDSFLNSTDSLLFLLDIISSILGTAFLKSILSAFLNDLLLNLGNEIKTFLKSNNTSQISSSNSGNFSLSIPMSLLDFNDLFKIDPNSIEGSQIFKSGSFNSSFYNDVLNGNNSSTAFGGGTQLAYNQSTNNVSVGSNNMQGSNESNLNSMLDNINIIDPTLVTNLIIDSLFHTVSRKKSTTGIKNDLQIENVINNILQENQNPFDIQIENLAQYEVEAKKIKAGVMTLDLGCDDENLILDKNFLTQNFNNPILQLDSALNSVLDNNQQTRNSAIDDKFYKSASSNLLMNIIKTVLLSPQMIIYLLIRALLLNGNTQIPLNIIDFLAQQYGLIRLIICYIKNKFVAYVFNMFRRELLRIILPVLKKIVKEKLLTYKNILVSLVKK